MSAGVAGGPHRIARHRTAIGLALAAAIVCGWVATHVYGVFFHRWTPLGIAVAPLLVLVQCWLSVGLFIVAHDCMHGSLVPFRPEANRAIGRLCLALYAGFSYDRLLGKHHAHHRHSGTAEDPDFHADGPRAFWAWYGIFFRRYFGLREFAAISALVVLYLAVFRVSPVNALVLWSLPALLSSLQLFYFGTYLPHRHDESDFAARNNARSLDLGGAASLLTCFHFGGYHHEHHASPATPWWRLPGVRG